MLTLTLSMLDETKTFLTNGYYKTEGILWQDYHASHLFTGISYTYLKLNNNGTFVQISKDEEYFDFLSFLKETPEFELHEDTSITYGTYVVVSNKEVIFSYQKIGLNGSFKLEIRKPELLISADQRVYNFIPATLK